MHLPVTVLEVLRGHSTSAGSKRRRSNFQHLISIAGANFPQLCIRDALDAAGQSVQPLSSVALESVWMWRGGRVCGAQSYIQGAGRLKLPQWRICWTSGEALIV
ncbi:hypothetical protein E2C01_058022 [Portunus trituberculatus]|uniref:Uncharacterized protein n=1 Tax=Portunus trituberculatus TaxID=210409 RepID=A0A5B7H4Y1_PORTR|nr:hypothetical protein [Portunus trituberculatus]